MARAAYLLVAACLCLLPAAPAVAQVDFAPKVHARLVPEKTAVAPGTTVTIALEERIRPGWHTYWSNPGDAGAPTEIRWTLPQGWNAGPIAWPFPKRLPVGPLMNYGYEGTLWLLSDLRVPASAKPGSIVTLKAAVDWLVCKDVCVPEDTTVSLALPIATAPVAADPATLAQFARVRAMLPVASPWPVRYQAGADRIDLFAAAPSLARARPTDAAFYPSVSGEVKGIAPQRMGFAREGLVLRVVPAHNFRSGGVLSGVFVLTSADGSVTALDVTARPGAVPVADFPVPSDVGLVLALVLAFAGGLILNLMPCVLPILAMKALALAEQAHASRKEARLEGFAYGAGAIMSFAAFGAMIVILRAGGSAIGWGFQLQEPVVVALFALLMLAVGLNLSGVYDVAPVAAGSTLTRRGGALGAFFTGVLAVAVAAPCTAPFMAAALGYALGQTALIAICVFLALGLGFAAPFAALGLFPVLQRVLPKPGSWMIRLRQILAFPMYATAVWLIWVLAQQTSRVGLAATLGAMVVLAFALWLWNATRSLGPRGRGVGALAALVVLIGALSCLTLLRVPASAALAERRTAIPSQPYSAAALDALRRENRPVFIDATAAWCVTCLVNEEAVLSRPGVREAFAARHVAFLLADWTNRNTEIADLLEAHARSGVPLYLYYAPGAADAQVLPQILTESEVLRTIGANSD